MTEAGPSPGRAMRFFRTEPVLSYFLLTFFLSWAGALAVVAPQLLRREPLPKLTGVLIFPAMLLGPSLSGVALTLLVDGRTGLRDLFRRMTRWRFSIAWYGVLFLPPVLVLAILCALRAVLSAVFTPNRFLAGVFFAIPAGILEEIGWMGFAFPKMARRREAFPSAIILGLLWSLWHVPAINFLGTATPHGSAWLPFFLAFATAMTAIRVLISWTYVHTQSVWFSQLLHISSTASLVVFSPTAVSATQEAFWYAFYAVVLWLVALLIRRGRGWRASPRV